MMPFITKSTFYHLIEFSRTNSTFIFENFCKNQSNFMIIKFIRLGNIFIICFLIQLKSKFNFIIFKRVFKYI